MSEKKEKIDVMKAAPPGPDTPEKNLFSARLYWFLMHITEGKYVIDDDNRDQMRRFSGIFSSQENDSRGCGVIGCPGSGKSILLRAMQQVIDRPSGPKRPVIYTALSLADMYSKDGPDVMKRALTKDMIIDDIGAEYVAAHYGTKVEVIENIVQIRYDQFQISGIRTHFTSNLTMEDIQNRYGDRVYSRLMQMCDIIVLTGADRRLSGVPFRWMEYPWPPDESFIDYMERLQNYQPENEPPISLGEQAKKKFNFDKNGNFDQAAYVEAKKELMDKYKPR